MKLSYWREQKEILEPLVFYKGKQPTGPGWFTDINGAHWDFWGVAYFDGKWSGWCRYRNNADYIYRTDTMIPPSYQSYEWKERDILVINEEDLNEYLFLG